MKCISLWQPWASAIALGLKQFETRSWPTSIRGPLAIHAAKRPMTRDELEDFHADPILCDAFAQAGLKMLADLPLGCVVATATLVDCIPTVRVPFGQGALEWRLGDYSPGRFAWALTDIVQLPEPIPARGSQGFWEWRTEEPHGPKQQALMEVEK